MTHFFSALPYGHGHLSTFWCNKSCVFLSRDSVTWWSSGPLIYTLSERRRRRRKTISQSFSHFQVTPESERERESQSFSSSVTGGMRKVQFFNWPVVSPTAQPVGYKWLILKDDPVCCSLFRFLPVLSLSHETTARSSERIKDKKREREKRGEIQIGLPQTSHMSHTETIVSSSASWVRQRTKLPIAISLDLFGAKWPPVTSSRLLLFLVYWGTRCSFVPHHSWLVCGRRSVSLSFFPLPLSLLHSFNHYTSRVINRKHTLSLNSRGFCKYFLPSTRWFLPEMTHMGSHSHTHAAHTSIY